MKMNTNFCKGITKKGTPCVRRCKSDYCIDHEKEYNSCPICMNDAVIEDTLSCGHMMCLSCSSLCALNGKMECPMCRQLTNIKNVSETGKMNKELSIKMTQMFVSKGKENRIEKAHQVMIYLFKKHYYFLGIKHMRDSVNERLIHFKENGMNVEKYEKQLASYMNRLEL